MELWQIGLLVVGGYVGVNLWRQAMEKEDPNQYIHSPVEGGHSGRMRWM